MSTSANAPSRGSVANRKGTAVFIAALIVAGVVFLPGVAGLAVLGGYVRFVGPPLDFDAPRDGQVVAHIDVLGKQPPDIARIRITDDATGATVWDVTPATPQSECWNRCWNLVLRAGSNPASFAAGHQQFNASVPQEPSFSLVRGRTYVFVVWDSRGRVAHDRFTL